MSADLGGDGVGGAVHFEVLLGLGGGGVGRMGAEKGGCWGERMGDREGEMLREGGRAVGRICWRGWTGADLAG